jgi:hypothetical protein
MDNTAWLFVLPWFYTGRQKRHQNPDLHFSIWFMIPHVAAASFALNMSGCQIQLELFSRKQLKQNT